jgi:GntR family transcriptional regulator
MDLRLRLDAANTTPIFQQIFDEFERMIVTGALEQGASLPSVRDLAIRHAVNPNTVSKAYQLLQSRNLAEPVRGLGLRVSRIDRAYAQARRAEILTEEIDRAITVARNLQATESEIIDLFRARWRAPN